MNEKALNPDALRLEEAFFAQENSRLLEKLREESRQRERREALRAAMGVRDEALIDALIDLDIYPETAAAFSLVPLVVVAWADGEIQSKEREAILKAATGRGIEKGSTTCKILENWLNHKPSNDVVDTWKRYVREISASMDDGRRAAFRDGVLAQARDVAEAAGGFLGLGDRVSNAEDKALEDLATAFG
jgi:tellurite resistance protein